MKLKIDTTSYTITFLQFDGGAEGEPAKPFELFGYEGPAGGYPGAEFDGCPGP